MSAAQETTAPLAGQVVVVTGAARGIGRGIAEVLGERGAFVVATDVLRSELGETADILGDRGTTLPHDVRDAGQWASVMTSAERVGPVTALVNNAGVIQWNVPIADLSEADFRRVIDVNQVGTFLGVKAAIEPMRRAGGGSIVNFSSTAGLIGYWGIAAYVASKWAIRGMTKTAAIELGPLGIRVNSVHPGNITTAMTTDLPEPDDQPLARRADPREIAGLVAFLVGPESAYSTGAEFVMDGGHTVGKTVLEND